MMENYLFGKLPILINGLIAFPSNLGVDDAQAH
jgi:hypothetical protein